MLNKLKNKNGFTLTEVLAVLILLGVIAAIVIPNVGKYQERMKDEYYNKLDASVLQAGKTYFKDNSSDRPNSALDFVSVDYGNGLVNNKYLKSVYEYNSSNKQCTGKVVAVNVIDDYIYKNCMSCEGEENYSTDISEPNSLDNICHFSESDEIKDTYEEIDKLSLHVGNYSSKYIKDRLCKSKTITRYNNAGEILYSITDTSADAICPENISGINYRNIGENDEVITRVKYSDGNEHDVLIYQIPRPGFVEETNRVIFDSTSNILKINKSLNNGSDIVTPTITVDLENYGTEVKEFQANVNGSWKTIVCDGDLTKVDNEDVSSSTYSCKMKYMLFVDGSESFDSINNKQVEFRAVGNEGEIGKIGKYTVIYDSIEKQIQKCNSSEYYDLNEVSAKYSDGFEMSDLIFDFNVDGYTIKGIKNKTTGRKIFDENGQHINGTIINSESDLYVDCELIPPSTITVTFSPNAEGATVSPKSKSVEKGPDKKYGKLPIPEYTGYTFTGWYTKASGGELVDANTVLKKQTSHTLYAHWEINKVTIKLKASSGTLLRTVNDEGTTLNWTRNSDGFLVKNSVLYEYKIKYGGSTSSSGLANYNNSKNLNIEYDGHMAVPSKEWKCVSGNCKKTTYDQDEQYEASDFCDLGTSSCTVVLDVNWRETKLIITYNANGGKLDTSKSASKYSIDDDGTVLVNSSPLKRVRKYSERSTGSITNPQKSGDLYIIRNYYHIESNKEYKPGFENGKKKSYELKAETSNFDADFINEMCPKFKKTDCEIVYYVNWKKNTVTVFYNANGGSINTSKGYTKESSTDNIKKSGSVYKTSYQYTDKDINLTDVSTFGLSKSGYKIVAKSAWVDSTDSNKVFSQENGDHDASDLCDARNGNCEIKLKANWKDNSIPECSISVAKGTKSSKSGYTSWYISDVELSMTAKAGGSGASLSKYGWGSSKSNAKSSAKSTLNKYTVSSNTKGTTIYGYVKNSSGNEAYCKKTVKIDKDYPTLNIRTINTSSAQYGYIPDGYVGSDGNTYYWKARIEITDKFSGPPNEDNNHNNTFKYSHCRSGTNTCGTISCQKGDFSSLWNKDLNTKNFKTDMYKISHDMGSRWASNENTASAMLAWSCNSSQTVQTWYRYCDNVGHCSCSKYELSFNKSKKTATATLVNTVNEC